MQVLHLGNRDSKTLLIQPVDDHDLATIENEAALIRSLTGKDFHLLAVRVNRWNLGLSPWPAPAVFGNEDFGGGAENTLRDILSLLPDCPERIFIGGYSLAGLFALWAGCRTDRFSGIAAASPSVWFPGFTDFMEQHDLQAGSVYLSLGDREEKTRNPVMSRVGECIRATHALLARRGIPCTLEWNEGNHFRDPDLRTAKAFAWLMKR